MATNHYAAVSARKEFSRNKSVLMLPMLGQKNCRFREPFETGPAPGTPHVVRSAFHRGPRHIDRSVTVFLWLCLCLWLAAPLAAAHESPQQLRVYFIGNSITDTVNYAALSKAAAARGHKLIWGRQSIPGAPLEWLWSHPTNGFTESPFGYPNQAFRQFTWDAISLQPFDRHLTSADASDDVTHIRRYAELASSRSPEVQLFLYARWPRITVGAKALAVDKNHDDAQNPGSGRDLSHADSYERRWLANYTGGWDNSNESRDYFDRLLLEARKATPFLRKPILLVPVGHALHALDQRMRAGEIPGYRDIHQFYTDDIHLNEAGSYLVGCVFYATLFREDPAGLPTEPYGRITPELARILSDVAWQTVRAHPESGVK